MLYAQTKNKILSDNIFDKVMIIFFQADLMRWFVIASLYLRVICAIVTHSGCIVEYPHAIGLYESLPAQFDVGDVPKAGQQAFADQHMALPCVIAVPVLVHRQQGGHVCTVHCTTSICF